MTGTLVSPRSTKSVSCAWYCLFVGGDGPRPEVVDLLVFVVADRAGVTAALRLENADGFALALDRAALGVDGLEIFVEENDRGCVLGLVRRVGLAASRPQLRNRLALVKPVAERGVPATRGLHSKANDRTRREAARDGQYPGTVREVDRHVQFPCRDGARVSTSCC